MRRAREGDGPRRGRRRTEGRFAAACDGGIRRRRAPQSRWRAAPPRDRPGPEVKARAGADERAPGFGILSAQQLAQRYVGFIAVPRIAVRHDELDRLRHQMHELRAVRI